jgi:hypothetical protein
MARDGSLYADGGQAVTMAALSTEWLDPGFYKVRLYGGGPWVPIEITMEDGDRDPETWELLSDQKLAAEWFPQTNSTRGFRVDPRRFFGRAFPIDRSEFQWLLTLRQMRY